MPPAPKRLLSTCCGMDLCWLCAWANFLAVSTTQIRFPLATSCAAFFIAFFFTRFCMTTRYRIIWLILGHMAGLGLMISAALFAGTGWRVPATLYHWYEMSLIAAMVCLFWYKGAKLPHRQMSYPSICNYFDLGISLLFTLLIIKLLLQIKAGIQVPESFTLYSIGAYFLFGLTAIFFSHTPTTGERYYLQGFRVYGGLISGAIILLLCIMAIAFALLPFMTSFAESGYSVLKQTAGPLSPYLVAMLRFIFSIRKSSVGNGNPQQHQTVSNDLLHRPYEIEPAPGQLRIFTQNLVLIVIRMKSRREFQEKIGNPVGFHKIGTAHQHLRVALQAFDQVNLFFGNNF